MADPLILPTRNVLAEVSNRDQRMIKWFEDTTSAVNTFTGTLSGGFAMDDGTATADGGFSLDEGGA